MSNTGIVHFIRFAMHIFEVQKALSYLILLNKIKASFLIDYETNLAYSVFSFLITSLIICIVYMPYFPPFSLC